MGNFALKTKDGEKIITVTATNMNEAVKLLAEIKKLCEKDLLTIYSIEKIS